MDVDALTEAALRFAGLVYYGDDREKPEDEQLQAQIPRGILFRQLMTFFVCLSEGRLRDKMLYLFRQFADAGGVMSRLVVGEHEEFFELFSRDVPHCSLQAWSLLSPLYPLKDPRILWRISQFRRILGGGVGGAVLQQVEHCHSVVVPQLLVNVQYTI